MPFGNFPGIPAGLSRIFVWIELMLSFFESVLLCVIFSDSSFALAILAACVVMSFKPAHGMGCIYVGS